MSNIKLIRIMRTFTQSEYSNFKKFAASPYFNEGRNLLPLIIEIKKYHPAYDEKKFTREKIFNALYPGKVYNSALLDKLFSRAAILAERFITQVAIEKDTFRLSMSTADEYMERNDEKLFYSALKESEKIINAKNPHEFNYFEQKKELEALKINFIFLKKAYFKHVDLIPIRGRYNFYDLLLKYMSGLTDLHITEFETNTDFSNELIVKAAEFIELEKLVKLLEKENNPYSGVIKLKYYGLNALANGSLESYTLYMALVAEKIHELPQKEKFNNIVVLTNICVRGISRKIDGFDLARLELARFTVDENINSYDEGFYTDLRTYIGLLNVFYKYKDDVYMEKLIERFSGGLEESVKGSFIAYTNMTRYISQKKFKEALSFHTSIDYEHRLLKINARISLLKLYYELGHFEELISLIDSTRKYFLNMDRYAPIKIDAITKFIKFLGLLVKARYSGNKNALTKLSIEIAKDKKAASKEWLLEKIAEL